jgi:hypothetical protein
VLTFSFAPGVRYLNMLKEASLFASKLKDTRNGQYTSSNDATSFAIAVAQKLGMRGERAHVCMIDDDGRLRSEWTYNRDRHQRSGNKPSSGSVVSLRGSTKGDSQ